jgi:hypothetical protein
VALSRHSGEYPFNKSNIVAVTQPSHDTSQLYGLSAKKKMMRVNASRRLPSCAKRVMPGWHYAQVAQAIPIFTV